MVNICCLYMFLKNYCINGLDKIIILKYEENLYVERWLSFG